MSAVFLIASCWPMSHGQPLSWPALSIAAAFAATAIFRPTLLGGANHLWMRFGVLLGHVVSPIALGILYYGVLTPIGVFMRIRGKDSLRLKVDPSASTYWIARTPPGPAPDSMTNQF